MDTYAILQKDTCRRGIGVLGSVGQYKVNDTR